MIISRKEVYCCVNNSWNVQASIVTESGKRLAGYIVKQTEAVLRKLTKYKYKISADLDGVVHDAVAVLAGNGISLEKEITRAVEEYYRELTKTVVKVDPGILSKIRKEALITQEKLTVEEDDWMVPVFVPDEAAPGPNNMPLDQNKVIDFGAQETLDFSVPSDDPWINLRDALSDTELNALYILLNDSPSLKQFADEQGVMLEVLMDGINEKAMDLVGDSLMDEEFVIYEDYEEQIRSMLEEV